MQFLDQLDFQTQIQDEQMIVLATNNGVEIDGPLLLDCERKGIAEMSQYLRLRFDIAAIFAAEGEARNPMVVQYLVDIMLYHLHHRLVPNKVPKPRVARYMEAKQWLKDVVAGTIDPDLPILTDEAGNPDIQTGPFRMGSKAQWDNTW